MVPAVAPAAAPTAAPTGPPTAPPTMAPPTAPPAVPPWAIAIVDIESADATSAPVISVRFKLASFFVEQRRRTTAPAVGSGRLHVFPDMKNARPAPCKRSMVLPNYPGRSEPNPHRAG